MSADLLRTAAQTLRDKAEGAEAISEGRWRISAEDESTVIDGGWVVVGQPATSQEADHIALMDPTVALAVADWLDAEAAIWEDLLTMKAEVSPKGYSLTWGESTQPQALAVARAVLRRES